MRVTKLAFGIALQADGTLSRALPLIKLVIAGAFQISIPSGILPIPCGASGMSLACFDP
jgi:hypothetical protein